MDLQITESTPIIKKTCCVKWQIVRQQFDEFGKGMPPWGVYWCVLSVCEHKVFISTGSLMDFFC